MSKIILAGALLFGVSFAYACDVCGCAGSSFSLGMLPNSRYHFIGIRSNFRSFESTGEAHNGLNHPKSSQLFSSTEFYARYKLNRKFQVLAFVPYVRNTQIQGNTKIESRGLGDVSALVNYVFIENNDSLGKLYKHSGTIGFGIKAPTGSYRLGIFSERNFLPGTGSTDFFVSLNYSLQRQRFGYLTESSFTYKTENKEAYRFGNALSTSHSLFFRWVVSEHLKIVPQLGMNYAFNWKDLENKMVSVESYNGGGILNAQANLSVMYKNWLFSATYLLPLKQQLNDGYVNQKTAFRFSMNYFISKK